MADNNRTYTTWMQTKVGDKTVVYLEGYVREDREGNTVTIKEVNGKDGPVNVATVLVSVTIGDRRAKNLLGYVNKEYGSYFVRISMFGSVCDRIQKYAPAKNQRLGFLGMLSINEYEGRNGVMKSLNLTANDFKVCTAKKEGGETHNPKQTSANNNPEQEPKKTTGNQKGGSAKKSQQETGPVHDDPGAFDMSIYENGFTNLDLSDELPYD